MRSIQKKVFEEYKHFTWLVLSWGFLLFGFYLIKKYIKVKYLIYISLDDYIPFMKIFIIPYVLWYFYIAVTLIYFLFISKEDLFKVQLNIFIGMSFCYFVYILFPNGISFRPEIIGNDILSKILRLLYTVDEPTSVLPSIHVFNAIAIFLSHYQSQTIREKKPLLISSFILMVLISASTVFIKQHSIVDVFCGIGLAAVLYLLIYKIPEMKYQNILESQDATE